MWTNGPESSNFMDEYTDYMFGPEVSKQELEPSFVSLIARGDRGSLYRAVIVSGVPAYAKDSATDHNGDPLELFVSVHIDDAVARCGINKMWKIFDALVAEKKKKLLS